MPDQEARDPVAQQVFEEVSGGARGEEKEMKKEQTATNPAMDEIYKQISYHTGKIQELLRKAKTYQRDGLFKKDGVTAEQFEAILNTGKRNERMST